MAILSIRCNAWVTGVFLALELLVVVTVSVLGLAHIRQPFTELLIAVTDGCSAVVLGLV
jgi:hypothetical protein